VTKAEAELKDKLAEAEKEYNKIKDEITQDLKKLIDDIKHALEDHSTTKPETKMTTVN